MNVLIKSLMNIVTKHMILAKKIQQYIKIIIHYDQVSSAGSSVKNLSLYYTTSRGYRRKNMIISIQKHISKNSAVLHDKSSQQIRNIGKLLQPERPPIIHLQPAS